MKWDVFGSEAGLQAHGQSHRDTNPMSLNLCSKFPFYYEVTLDIDLHLLMLLAGQPPAAGLPALRPLPHPTLPTAPILSSSANGGTKLQDPS